MQLRKHIAFPGKGHGINKELFDLKSLYKMLAAELRHAQIKPMACVSILWIDLIVLARMVKELCQTYVHRRVP